MKPSSFVFRFFLVFLFSIFFFEAVPQVEASYSARYRNTPSTAVRSRYRRMRPSTYQAKYGKELSTRRIRSSKYRYNSVLKFTGVKQKYRRPVYYEPPYGNTQYQRILNHQNVVETGSRAYQNTPFGTYPTDNTFYRSAEEDEASYESASGLSSRLRRLYYYYPLRRSVNPQRYEKTPYGTYPTDSQSSVRQRSATRSVSSAQSGPVVTVRRLSVDNDFVNGKELSTPALQIGVANHSASRSTQLPKVYELRSLDFEIKRQGIFETFSELYMEIDDQRIRIRPGMDRFSVKLQNVRLAAGEDMGFPVKIGIDDDYDGILPRRYGSIRLNLIGATASEEFTNDMVPVTIRGVRSSEYLTWNPAPGASFGGTGQTVFGGKKTVQIFGRTLGAGEVAKVLAVKFSAYNDDLAIRRITVRELLSSGGIDHLADQLELVDEYTGQVVDTGYFTNGEVTFNLRDTFVNRGGERLYSFRLYLKHDLRTDSHVGQLKLDIGASDIEVYGLSNGKDLGADNKNVRIDSATFALSNVAGGIRFSGPQPSLAAIVQPNPAARFCVQNPGTRKLSLARMTFQVFPSGSTFASGSIPSASDFRLTQFANSQDYSTGWDNVTVIDQNTIRFDHSSEHGISRGSENCFSLWVALKRQNNDDVSLGVKILGDSSFSSGTLASVRASGANFIASDNGARPHSTSSTDWTNGFLTNGLPTNLYVNKER